MGNPGKYNKKIVIIKKMAKKMPDGTIDDNIMHEVLRCYAEIKTTRGATLIANDSDFEQAYTRFTIRYNRRVVEAYYQGLVDRADFQVIETSNRNLFIVYDGVQYLVEYLNNIDENNIEIELQARRVTGYG